MADLTYELYTGPLNSAPYSLEAVPTQCDSFEVSSKFEGAPNFMSVLPPDRLQIESSVKTHSGTYPIDLVVTI